MGRPRIVFGPVPDPFDDLLAAAESRLSATSKSYGKISHLGERGSGREEALAHELRDLLPKKYSVSRGLVLGRETEQSGQLDIVIHDATNYPTLSYQAGNLFVPESVYGIVSVKSVVGVGDVLGEHQKTAAKTKKLIAEAGGAGNALYTVFAYAFDGSWDSIRDAYAVMMRSFDTRGRVDALLALAGAVLCDARRFGIGDSTRKGAAVEGTTDHDPISDACQLRPTASTFSGFYKLLLTGLADVVLQPLKTGILPRYVASARVDGRVTPPTAYQYTALTQVITDLKRRGLTEVTFEQLDRALATPGLRDGVDPLYEPLGVGLVMDGLRLMEAQGEVVVSSSTVRST